MMDEDPAPKPYHGVRWLENDNWNHKHHHLAGMPGCYVAKPCDMDGDGDLDIVYSALYFHWQQADFPSLAWLENTGGFRTFKPQRIAYTPSNLANRPHPIPQSGRPHFFSLFALDKPNSYL